MYGFLCERRKALRKCIIDNKRIRIMKDSDIIGEQTIYIID